MEIIKRFGHTIEFEMSNSTCPPDAPIGAIGGAAMTQFVRFDGGEWCVCVWMHCDMIVNIKNCETIEQILESIFRYDNDVIEKIMRKWRDEKIDGLLDE